MQRLDQVVLDWGDGLDVVVTVEVRPRGRNATAADHRLAEVIAAQVWMAEQEEDARTTTPE